MIRMTTWSEGERADDDDNDDDGDDDGDDDDDATSRTLDAFSKWCIFLLKEQHVYRRRLASSALAFLMATGQPLILFTLSPVISITS